MAAVEGRGQGGGGGWKGKESGGGREGGGKAAIAIEGSCAAAGKGVGAHVVLHLLSIYMGCMSCTSLS